VNYYYNSKKGDCFQKQMYYNFENLKCVYKKYDNQECRQTSECLPPMKCLLNNQKCECQTNDLYFDPINMNCLNKTLINSKCESDRTCHTDLGLSCKDRKCVCNSKTSFWSHTQSKCIQFLKYGQIGCTSSQQCSLNLVCNVYPLFDKNNCTCPVRSMLNMCDCERSRDKQMYWNGVECVQAGLKDSKCKKYDYECMDSLICLDRLGQCDAKSSFLRFFLKSNSNRISSSHLYLILIVITCSYYLLV